MTKPAPSKPAEKKPTKTRQPLPDFSGIKSVDAPDVKYQRERQVLKTPFPALVKESRETGKAKGVAVPAESEAQVKSLIRSAADLAGHGMKFGPSQPGPDGTVIVHFQARDKAKRTPKS